MELLFNIGSFGLKLLLVVAAIMVVVSFIGSLIQRSKGPSSGQVLVTPVHEHYRELSATIRRAILDRKEWKAQERARKEKAKNEKKQSGKSSPAERSKVFLLEFHGGLAAAEVADLREQISAILPVVTSKDEVVVKLESSGGLVHNYGLAASQLARLREKGIPLTVCVDKIAASGGYLMACVANNLFAAPFAIVGSIGVVAMFPNFNRLLQKFDVDYMELTAGEYKRTVSMLGKVTEKGRQKFEEELEETHELFKSFITKFRPNLEMDRIATGEHWYGSQAVDLKLIDAIITSDDYIMSKAEESQVYRVEYQAPKSVKEKLAGTLTEVSDRVLLRWWQRLINERRFHL